MEGGCCAFELQFMTVGGNQRETFVYSGETLMQGESEVWMRLSI
jgi:hypothetical protein